MPGDASGRSRSASRAWRRGSAVLVALTVGALSLVAACGGVGDGRALRAPSPDQTTTTVAPQAATTAGVDAGSATGGGAGTTPATEPLRVSSTAIAEGGEIPADFTCRGRDVSPPLLWTAVPEGTAEIAVVVRDVDADGFVHWVIAGLAPTTGGLAEATPPAASVEAVNDFGRPGWSGPCPPAGTHNYEIEVYALSQASGVTDGQDGAGAAAQVEATPALMSAALSGWVSAP
jgi:Raf kinase inhibitor-like YbhB/YbcL family protein